MVRSPFSPCLARQEPNGETTQALSNISIRMNRFTFGERPGIVTTRSQPCELVPENGQSRRKRSGRLAAPSPNEAGCKRLDGFGWLVRRMPYLTARRHVWSRGNIVQQAKMRLAASRGCESRHLRGAA